MEKIKKAFRSGLKALRNLLPGNTPDFIIVGAQKAGTTSLHYYLKQHPKLVGSSPKEVRFFNTDYNYQKGFTWYSKAFRDAKNPFKRGLFFEATPMYLYDMIAAERMHEFKPTLKIIIILRDPIKRAYSAWNMYRDFPIKFGVLPNAVKNNAEVMEELYSGVSFPSFDECFEMELKKINSENDDKGAGIIRRGIYLSQIKKYHELFGKNNVLILGFNDLITQKKETLNKVLNFLDVEKSDWNFLNDEEKNVRSYPNPLSEEIKTKLEAFYAPYNEELFTYLGNRINW